MAALIEPKVLKGFRDFLPPAEIVRRNLTEKIEASFRSFGFVPIDTPALEYAEILLGKGGGETEKQIYRFKDNGERDVALRFDLTVPFARFVALHQGEIAFPFKRYHIGKVWRGENTQRGRYREFTQCDFDIIGSDSPAADFEILLMIQSTLQNLGLGVGIRVNHRGLFNRFLAHIGIIEKSADILRTVDKLAKTGLDETRRLLAEIAGDSNAGKILDFTGAGGAAAGGFQETLDRITALSGGASPESERLALLRRFMLDAGAGDSFSIDPSITRGLDYYTGVVFETFLTELPGIGSICSGGRYDNLAGLYSKTRISGVGSSIGLDRMIAALESLGRLPGAEGCARAAIACVNAGQSGLYQALAGRFRQTGIPCEVFLEEAQDGKLVKQFMLAEKKGLQYVIIPGAEPLRDGLAVRDIAQRRNCDGLSFEEAARIIGGE
ncbi:MAG: histidine--tRNA ligase [Treponema sp.]|jgi:histidyl-tRNA synthetase|nr:histidine--tRNA ligase [Treponema sp.]